MAKQATAERSIIRLPRALPKQTRQLVESAIERHQAATEALLVFLDEADGDPDLEPSLAGTAGDDREYDPADPAANEGLDETELEGTGTFGDSEDYEPSLGWTESGERGGWNDMEADYVAFRNGIGQGMTADMEPDVEADHEPRLPPFVLNQENGRAL
jgi:hypothetical protein